MLADLTKAELLEMANNLDLKVSDKMKKQELIELIENAPISGGADGVISLDNSTIKDEVIKEEEIIPKKFNPAKQVQIKSDKSGKLIRNRRVYKVLNNGLGMYADTGEIFKI